MKNKKMIEKQLEKICQILDELQYNEIEQFISIQRSQSAIIKKLEKINEYNEIDDMNNAIMYKKLTSIEQRI